MSNWTPLYNNDDRKEDKPPYSRIFVVCSKDLRKQDLLEPFEKFGEVEDLYMLKDRNTGKSRGVAYVKYSKTSSAAAAIQELHLKTIANSDKPIKVMVATNKNDKNDSSTEKHNRLFIKVPKLATEEDLKEHFSQFGTLDSVYIQKDKSTNESKGLAYVQYQTFLDAAKAFENCDKHYKAVFAEPKQELKRGRDSRLNDNINLGSISGYRKDSYMDYYEREVQDRQDMPHGDNLNSLIKIAPQNYKTIQVTCTPLLPQKHIERLFNIVPGMVQCQFSTSVDTFSGICKAVITYEDERAAAYAVERLNNYEFPSGELVTVKPDNPLSKAASDLTSIVNSFKNAVDAGSPDLVQLADAIAQASTLIKAATTGRLDMKGEPAIAHDMAYCSVTLPPAQPLAPSTAQTVQRCFIVCKPRPPPTNILKDVFCRFGDLIDIVTFPNKTFAFVKYASTSAAQEAINVLHGATVCGVYLKVLEAKDNERVNMDIDQHEFSDLDMDRKRMRLIDKD